MHRVDIYAYTRQRERENIHRSSRILYVSPLLPVINSSLTLRHVIDSLHGNTLSSRSKEEEEEEGRDDDSRRAKVDNAERLSSTLDLRPPELFENYFELSD